MVNRMDIGVVLLHKGRQNGQQNGYGIVLLHKGRQNGQQNEYGIVLLHKGRQNVQMGVKLRNDRKIYEIIIIYYIYIQQRISKNKLQMGKSISPHLVSHNSSQSIILSVFTHNIHQIIPA